LKVSGARSTAQGPIAVHQQGKIAIRAEKRWTKVGKSLAAKTTGGGGGGGGWGLVALGWVVWFCLVAVVGCVVCFCGFTGGTVFYSSCGSDRKIEHCAWKINPRRQKPGSSPRSSWPGEKKRETKNAEVDRCRPNSSETLHWGGVTNTKHQSEEEQTGA